jgi:hypothetical protein
VLTGFKPRDLVPLVILIAGAAAAPRTSVAHHSGLYDENDIVEISGTIESLAWVNPHVRITLATGEAGGNPQTWLLEGTSVNALERWGLTPGVFEIGAPVIARGPRSRFGRNAMIAATLELRDGAEIVLWPNVASRLGLAETGVPGLFPPPAASADAATRPSGIFGVWTPRGRPRTVPGSLALTEGARASASTYDPLEDDPALRCIPPGMPVMLDTPYPVEFVDGGDRIVMRFEEWDAERTIYMNPANGPPAQDPSPKGVSFGRWEGNTLAIFTLYINYPYFDDLGTPQSESVTVLERYTPSNDDSRLDWEVTVTDPGTFIEPVVRRGFMVFEPGETIKPFNCTLVDDDA